MEHEITGFEHLHRHSDFSLLDGYATVEEYARYSKEAEQQHLCITDHGMMGAVPQQIKWAADPSPEEKEESKKNPPLNPIFGCELYINPEQPEVNSKDEMSKHYAGLNEDEKKRMRKSHHLVAIAQTNEGYRNLVHLSSWGWLHGFYYRPRINREVLARHQEGIIFGSACINGEVGNAWRRGGDDEGFDMVKTYKELLGDRFRLEIMLLDYPDQRPYNEFVVRASQRFGIRTYLSCDAHYCRAEDAVQQMYLLMIQTNMTLAEMKLKQEAAEQSGEKSEFFELSDRNLFNKTEREINSMWEEKFQNSIDYEFFKEAKRETVRIAESTRGVKIDRSSKLPHPFPDEEAKLREEIERGLKWRGLEETKLVRDRIEEEYRLICRKEFCSYFLIEQMVCQEARRAWKEIMGWGSGWEAIGPGRGSGVGSLVNYVLGITDVNPLLHNLLFSRFMSPARGGRTIQFDFKQKPISIREAA